MSYQDRQDIEGYTGSRYRLARAIASLVVAAILFIFWAANN